MRVCKLFCTDTQIEKIKVIRILESIAFALHGLLGVTEPCTGCLRGAFRQEKGSGMPDWFWPVAGLVLWFISAAN